MWENINNPAQTDLFSKQELGQYLPWISAACGLASLGMSYLSKYIIALSLSTPTLFAVAIGVFAIISIGVIALYKPLTDECQIALKEKQEAQRQAVAARDVKSEQQPSLTVQAQQRSSDGAPHPRAMP